MSDIKQLYIELISDFDPYGDITEHETLTESEMLYNLQEIRNNFTYIDYDETIIKRFNTLIDLFIALGIKAYF